jgi:hypothetical protein
VLPAALAARESFCNASVVLEVKRCEAPLPLEMVNQAVELQRKSTSAPLGPQAGWRIVRTDGPVHQFPLIPGRNPFRWEALEANRPVRKLFSPFAYTYFVTAPKPQSAK